MGYLLVVRGVGQRLGLGPGPRVSPPRDAASVNPFDGCCGRRFSTLLFDIELSRAASDRRGGAGCGRTRCELTLALLVARVLANDHDAAVATNHLALVTDFLDAGLDLHRRGFLLIAGLVPGIAWPFLTASGYL
ncbi:hypothetical protein GCM10011490_12830 [Pseudoclavibacter endophyticus]|nr:hypothetical protein GCM10011490_12830 [Pseudoclavibacter endophyticus]